MVLVGLIGGTISDMFGVLASLSIGTLHVFINIAGWKQEMLNSSR